MGQILIKTPITTDGTTPYIIDGKAQYREDVAEAAARPALEKINEKLPTHLKMVIENYVSKEVVPEKQVQIPVDNQKELEELRAFKIEAEKAIAENNKKIANEFKKTKDVK